MVRLAVVVSVSILISGVAEAQSPAMPEELKNAQALFQQQKYAEAAAAYEAIIKAEKGAKDPRSRAGIAASLYNLQEYARALPYAQEASRMIDDAAVQFEYPGLPPGAVWLRLARIYNKLGRSDDAFAALTTAAKYPIPNARSLEADDDLAALRSDTRWKTFWETVTSNVDPCNTAPEFRQLDFWIGEWDVLGGAGQVIGTSKIERILGNCVILETYTAAPGSSASPAYVGQAFHFYDPNAKKWVQHYIDTTATPFDWTGQFVNAEMRYTREGLFGPKNLPVQQRMTFTKLPDGKVRQLFEQSADGGKTWRAGFNGTYVKRAAKSDSDKVR
jgi:tetratricopeptide (TPR) repeat protein